ncbi:RNA-binding S4 domain-containing protein [Pseudopelagicola sp. nBUS_19]|uniref:RNA-binding S4 domain-containing protein n=1 Tax=Pseudopelagicola sp. nBUS_19 TaxID=3395316 RepID=UPI003EC034DD
MFDPGGKQRLDKWLYQARFFKTRTLAAKSVTGGRVRVNGRKVVKASCCVGRDDVLTFSQGSRVCVARVVGLGFRRGPAKEARTLYVDLSPDLDSISRSPGSVGKGRPTKRDRRNLDALRASRLED